MSYAALVRPAIDRVYIGMRAAARPRLLALTEQTGLRQGLNSSFYFGLLARPLPADGFAAVTAYAGGDMSDELAQGTMAVDDAGNWSLTGTGHTFTLALQQAAADAAQEHWAQTFRGALPGEAVLPRLAELLGVLLKAGEATGGPAFRAATPVYEPAGASYALQVSTRMGALRHHRGDAHRAAWAAAGLTVEQLRALSPADPLRVSIEQDTNRRDEPIYQALTESERWELLGLLAALPN
ncbi:hypothetical protein [Catellatospora citrea]|uniref:Uncharacterized protein n=1 Tax=Catellatospora citrea TaxID=53366 RepID=A0A8J3KKR3_9ACTN|nr:hypothetical protein [Catellatospora citrea]RKE02863.1 hypothetical protein C8E86_8172 [Catellatospora citrea]GIG01582.1 hypothetical protein Cci01nite_66750 [Catellatospora citrea]